MIAQLESLAWFAGYFCAFWLGVLLAVLAIAFLLGSRERPPALVNLNRAAICHDCDAIYSLLDRACPACGSRERTAITHWIAPLHGARIVPVLRPGAKS